MGLCGGVWVSEYRKDWIGVGVSYVGALYKTLGFEGRGLHHGDRKLG